MLRVWGVVVNFHADLLEDVEKNDAVPPGEIRNAALQFSKNILISRLLHPRRRIRHWKFSRANTTAFANIITVAFSVRIALCLAGTSAIANTLAWRAKFSSVGIDHGLQRSSL